jgi:hypothetical protein
MQTNVTATQTNPCLNIAIPVGAAVVEGQSAAKAMSKSKLRLF